MNPLAALALSGALLSANPSEAPLPPNHPPIGNAAASATVPNGHPPMESGKAAPSAEELIQKLDATPGVKDGDKPFEIAVTLGHLYASNARYVDAIDFFRQAEKKAQPLRTFTIAARRQVKGALPRAKDCPKTEALEQQVEALKALAPAQQASCGIAAMAPALEATARRGNLHLLMGDAKTALEAWESVLEVNPQDPEASYSKAALVLDTKGEDLAALKAAKASLETLTATYPMHPRSPVAHKLIRTLDEAISAGGMQKRAALRAEDRKIRLSKGIPKPSAPVASAPMMGGQGGPMMGGGTQQGGPMQGAGAQQGGAPMLSQSTIDAVQAVERTPEFEANLVKLLEQGEEHLAKGQFNEALNAYRQVMPYKPDDSRTRAGLAWVMVKLNRQPMADRVWSVAISDPKSVEALGDVLKAKGDAAGAKAVWAKLAESRPDYAEALKSKLK